MKINHTHLNHSLLRVYTHDPSGQEWLTRYQGTRPLFACILGFTETGLIPGISAAGATPESRRYTAVADAEFLIQGPTPHPRYPLPPLTAGASPVLISRAVVAALNIPVYLFNAGLSVTPSVPTLDLGGMPARCLSTGQAMDRETVETLLQQGLSWGEKLTHQADYLIIGECVVGGTTTALSVLAGLGFPAAGKVNSSHPTCNHAQKWAVVQAGLTALSNRVKGEVSPLDLVAAVGDPMQVVAAGMAIAASRSQGVLLAGGTQMLAVYALAAAIATTHHLPWQPQQVVVGTTRWVVEDPTADTVGLALSLPPVPLIATQLSFASSRYASLQAYEQGFVKEGMGAGGCAIAASLMAGWEQTQLLQVIETLTDHYQIQGNESSDLSTHRL